jgi:RHS repeat-associated protein
VAQYQYDGRGNLARVTDGADVTQYAYDAADRLSGVTLPDGTAVAYTYDAAGWRVRQSVAAQVTNYLWDEISPYGDVVLETDGGGSTLASYVLGGTELLSQTRGGVTSYYLHDGQGSTRALSDDSGAVTGTYAYTAFGELYAQTGTTTNAYLYTGQQFDTLTGLYSLRARYYVPAIGRFLSQDTANLVLMAPVEIDRYVYTANNPINSVDPGGLQAFVEYSEANQTSQEESAAIKPVGENVASELEAVGNEFQSTQYLNPTGRQFASETPTTWQKAEQILGKDLGLPKNHQVYRSVDYGLEGNRIPDFVGKDFIADAKWYNESILSANAQLRDFVTIAQQTSKQLFLYVRQVTVVTSNALKIIESTGGNVIWYFP